MSVRNFGRPILAGLLLSLFSASFVQATTSGGSADPTTGGAPSPGSAPGTSGNPEAAPPKLPPATWLTIDNPKDVSGGQAGPELAINHGVMNCSKDGKTKCCVGVTDQPYMAKQGNSMVKADKFDFVRCSVTSTGTCPDADACFKEMASRLDSDITTCKNDNSKDLCNCMTALCSTTTPPGSKTPAVGPWEETALEGECLAQSAAACSGEEVAARAIASEGCILGAANVPVSEFSQSHAPVTIPGPTTDPGTDSEVITRKAIDECTQKWCYSGNPILTSSTAGACVQQSGVFAQAMVAAAHQDVANAMDASKPNTVNHCLFVDNVGPTGTAPCKDLCKQAFVNLTALSSLPGAARLAGPTGPLTSLETKAQSSCNSYVQNYSSGYSGRQSSAVQREATGKPPAEAAIVNELHPSVEKPNNQALMVSTQGASPQESLKNLQASLQAEYAKIQAAAQTDPDPRAGAEFQKNWKYNLLLRCSALIRTPQAKKEYAFPFSIDDSNQAKQWCCGAITGGPGNSCRSGTL